MADELDKIWKKFLSKHWQMLILWIIAGILVVTGAIYVFLWHVGNAQATGLVPETLDLWAMNHLVIFILYLIVWEFLYVGIPTLVAIAAIYFRWWKRLPDKERKEYKDKKLFGKRSKKSDAGGGITFLINLAFIIIVYLDGNWIVPFATWTFDYLVYTYLWAIIWLAIIFGIPMLLGGTAWLVHNMRKK